MKIFPSRNLEKSINDKLILLDNDFLSYLHSDENIFKEIVGNYPDLLEFGLIDQLTEFEFLRDLYLPKELIIREEFLKNFARTTLHAEISGKLHPIALFLTKIYKLKKSSKMNPSLVDIFLGARMILQNLSIITANKKDFPAIMFDVSGLITVIDEENAISKNFYLIEVNQQKYRNCIKDLEKIEHEQKEEIEPKV